MRELVGVRDARVDEPLVLARRLVVLPPQRLPLQPLEDERLHQRRPAVLGGEERVEPAAELGALGVPLAPLALRGVDLRLQRLRHLEPRLPLDAAAGDGLEALVDRREELALQLAEQRLVPAEAGGEAVEEPADALRAEAVGHRQVLHRLRRQVEQRDLGVHRARQPRGAVAGEVAGELAHRLRLDQAAEARVLVLQRGEGGDGLLLDRRGEAWCAPRRLWAREAKARRRGRTVRPARGWRRSRKRGEFWASLDGIVREAAPASGACTCGATGAEGAEILFARERRCCAAQAEIWDGGASAWRRVAWRRRRAAASRKIQWPLQLRASSRPRASGRTAAASARSGGSAAASARRRGAGGGASRWAARRCSLTVCGPHEARRPGEQLDCAALGAALGSALCRRRAPAAGPRAPRLGRAARRRAPRLRGGGADAAVPRTQIDVSLSVLQTDGGVRAACINATTLALADAGIAMADVVAARARRTRCTARLLDLNAQEDGACAELSVGYLPRSETVSFVHLESKAPLGAVDETVNYALEAASRSAAFSAPPSAGAPGRRSTVGA